MRVSPISTDNRITLKDNVVTLTCISGREHVPDKKEVMYKWLDGV